MTQGVLPFKYEEEKKDFCTTSLSGSLLFLDLLHKMGFFKIVGDNLKAKSGVILNIISPPILKIKTPYCKGKIILS